MVWEEGVQGVERESEIWRKLKLMHVREKFLGQWAGR
jgi:hypothetical protein